MEDGIPQNFIYALHQDQNGFLWIGTGEGLARFDGRDFKIYRSEMHPCTVLLKGHICLAWVRFFGF